eukprot:7158094-Pyramimonas_sp.AAC.1
MLANEALPLLDQAPLRQSISQRVPGQRWCITRQNYAARVCCMCLVLWMSASFFEVRPGARRESWLVDSAPM